jgi:feruloyl esterase
MRLLAAISLAALAGGCTTAPTEQSALRGEMAGPAGCTSLTAADLGAATASAKWIAANEGLPAFCEVTAQLRPANGSQIGVVYRLPASWNGKLLGIGGGGWVGNVTLGAASEGLRKGFATLQTDGGHESTSPWENGWASNPEAATDFAHRAVHLMTVHGKRLAQTYFGREQDRAYFQGCSTGGRMALMEAQRYPEDYDAIIAGAPVYTLQVQTSAVFRNMNFARGNGAGGFTPADLQLVQDRVMASCDASDGLVDGLVNDPRSCNFDPRALQCTGAKTATCLAPTQVDALRAAYDGVRASDGSWSMLPMSRGGEAGWSLFVGTDGSGADATGGGGLAGLRPVIFGERAVDFNAFTDGDYLTVRRSPFAAMYEAKEPDLSPFFERGGKLIVWHGESDPGPSPVGTNDYIRAVAQTNPEAAAQMRYFLLPGVGHCRGGPGADVTDTLAALDQWFETGVAPERLIGTKADGSLTRPHCAFPTVARYSGSGDANDPARWSCVAPTG